MIEHVAHELISPTLPTGDLHNRTWQRSPTGTGPDYIATQYLLDDWGRLQTINYPDTGYGIPNGDFDP